MPLGLLAAFCASTLAIFPTLDRDPDQAGRPIREDEPSIRDVQVTTLKRVQAREALAGRERIAVLTFSGSRGDPGSELSALGCTQAMIADLHYVPGLLVLERAEVLRARRGAATAAEIGRRLGVRYLITGTFTRGEASDRLEAEAIEIVVSQSETESKPLAKASASRPGGQVLEMTDAVLLDLLAQLKATPPPDRIAEMTKVSTNSDSARALCDDGAALMDRAVGLNRGDDPGLSTRALKDTEAAMKADPRYLRASLLQAGCLLRLGETVRLERCLSNASNLRVNIPEGRIDALTRLELEGDHAVFVKHDFEDAVAQYQRMLEIDPGHLHALWMLSALHAGEYESSRWAGYSLEKAGDYAARLIVAHPGTAAARMIGEQEKRRD
jgi:TolB-like protein